MLIARLAAAQVPPQSVAEYQHDRWLVRDGLPGTRVEAILQSPDGYLWFSTLNGLIRFDGARFMTFDPTNTPALKNADAFPIRPLLVDHRGTMWIGTTAGLAQYVAGELRRVPSRDSTSAWQLGGMVEDGAGRLWAFDSVRAGTLLLRRGDHFEPVTVRPALRHRITALAVGQRGEMWLGTAGAGLVRVRGDSATSFTSRDGLVDDFVMSLDVGRDGTVWIGNQRGFTRLKDGVFSAHSLASLGGLRGMVSSLAEARDGTMWMGTDDFGLLRWRDGRVTSYAMHDRLLSNLTDNFVASVFIDREGTVWVGTGVGLDQFRTASFLTFSPGEGLEAASPGALHWDASGQLWVAPKSGGLLRGAPGAFVAVAPRALSSIRFNAITPARAGGVWLGSDDALLWFADGIVRRYDSRNGLTGGWVLAIVEDRRARVWAGTLTGGVQRLEGGRITSFGAREGLVGGRVRTLLEDREGAIWVGTVSGISRISGDSVSSYYADAGRPGPSVTDIHEDRSGRLWFGTVRGLARIVGGRVAVIDMRHGLPGAFVASITEDDAGNLWLTTSKGIVRVSADEAAAVTEGRQRSVHATSFGTLDGLASAAPVLRAQPASLRSPDGRLWFSTPRGLAVFDPRRLMRNPHPPPVRVEELVADGTPMPLGGTLSVPPRTRRLDLRYTGLSLRVPERVRFRYKLEGFDRDWVDAGAARSVSFTNLAPRGYRFRVTASNEDGIWNEQGAVLDFRVLPAFYQSRWFYLFLALAGVAAAWGLVRLRQHQLEQRFALVLAERNRMAREIHDTLLQGFTGITLQLQATLGDVTRAPERAKEQIDRILTLADKTLVDARHSVRDMRAPALLTQSLAEALEDLTRRVSNGDAPVVRFRLVGPPRALTPATEVALFRIGQEAVANAIKHAAARAVDIELAYERRTTKLAVRDDGCGFHLDEQLTARSGHWGLLGMRERAEQAGARFAVTSARGRGTEVTVVAPGT